MDCRECAARRQRRSASGTGYRATTCKGGRTGQGLGRHGQGAGSRSKAGERAGRRRTSARLDLLPPDVHLAALTSRSPSPQTRTADQAGPCEARADPCRPRSSHSNRSPGCVAPGSCLPLRAAPSVSALADVAPGWPCRPPAAYCQISDTVVRILGQNPGKFTLQGTNTYLIGHSPYTLLDTGEGKAAYLPLLAAQLGGSGTIGHIVISHQHKDHWGGLTGVLGLLRDRGAPRPKIHKWRNLVHDQDIIGALPADSFLKAEGGDALHALADGQVRRRRRCSRATGRSELTPVPAVWRRRCKRPAALSPSSRPRATPTTASASRSTTGRSSPPTPSWVRLMLCSWISWARRLTSLSTVRPLRPEHGRLHQPVDVPRLAAPTRLARPAHFVPRPRTHRRGRNGRDRAVHLAPAAARGPDPGGARTAAAPDDGAHARRVGGRGRADRARLGQGLVDGRDRAGDLLGRRLHPPERGRPRRCAAPSREERVAIQADADRPALASPSRQSICISRSSWRRARWSTRRRARSSGGCGLADR